MTAIQKTVTATLLILLAAIAHGWWYTNQSAGDPVKTAKTTRQVESSPAVDESALVTARRLGQLASTPEEQTLAQSAERLADHELDLAFTSALRQVEAHPPALNPEARQIEDRLRRSQKLLDSDQANVVQLTAAVAQARGPQLTSLQDQLDLAQSQVELDRDEVEEANQDLLEAGGNLHQRIQAMMQERAAMDHSRPAATPSGNEPLASLHGLAQRIRQWLALRRKERWLAESSAQAASRAAQLSVDRQKLASQLETNKESVPELARHTRLAKTANAQAVGPGSLQDAGNPQNAGDAASLLGATRRIATDQKLLTLLDQRISDLRQLAQVYRQWSTIATAQARSVLHTALLDAAIVIVIILVLLFVDRWLEGLLTRTRLDRRQIETLRSVTRGGLQILGVLIILVLVVGLPRQLGTMLGIAGAGLTVALKDFIVAFIGWLVLMGKNGVRLGDRVEINAVSGEVVELGMFHTVLLETGNWTDAGHPTGRRVTFTNSFAVQGHYFNFSTSGQWLWDELLVLVPYGRDPHSIADTIHKEVLEATAEDSREAEQEWRRTVQARRGGVLSATPGIIVRPAVGGVEVAVRYVTRASERFRLRTRLYQSAVQLLAHNSPPRQA